MLLTERQCLDLLGHALEHDIVPALAEGSAKYAASLACDTIAELRRREDVVPGIVAALVPEGLRLLGELEALNVAVGAAPAKADWQAQGDAPSWRRLMALLDAGGRFVLDHRDGADAALDVRMSEWLRAVAGLELQFYERLAATSGGGQAPAVEVGELDRTKLEAHLRARIGDPSLAVTAFEPVMGGLANQTYFFELTAAGETRRLVARKNPGVALFSHGLHRARAEYEVLRLVHAAGLPVAEPLWLFTDQADVAGDFYIMTRLDGRNVGNLAGASERLPEELMLNLARFLARLHRIPLDHFKPFLDRGDLPVTANDTIEQAVRANVGQLYDVWRQSRRFPSPTEAYVIDWLRRDVPRNAARPCLVHTDCFVHNMLVDGNDVTGVVDWEAAHFGDPAEDLAYIQDSVSAFVDWGRFMEAYRAGGGAAIDEESFGYYRAMLHFRNCFGSNVGAARVREGFQDLRSVRLTTQFLPIFLKNCVEGTKAGHS
ncbi:MAG: phosphotransferase family protein [Novosphingobium sp.]|jgi:aminoglycoside phosphotransferase (APT) family kinase protein|nr:phosphotransferase family protein [Novosphingobium sp.]